MSKAVLISINPKWCAMIASGEKTVEVRKNRPKLETPFKCYIYCTKGQTYKRTTYLRDPLYFVGEQYPVNGKVIGEFICDTYIKDLTCGHDPLTNGAACISEEQAAKYANGKTLYGWHISDLKIYDTPKELGEFYHWIVDTFNRVWHAPVTRPPQSWMYIDD